MIPKKVKEHLEEYINQEVYVQIAIIKGKEKVSTHLAINKYFNSINLNMYDLKGMVWGPIRGWRLSNNTSINYIAVFKK